MNSTKITRQFLFSGILEGYSYLVLLFIAMPMKYMFDYKLAVTYVGAVHGILAIVYVIYILLMYHGAGLSLKKSIVAFILSLVPFGTFYLKRLLK